MALSTLNLSTTTLYTARDALETARFELASGIEEYYVIDARKSYYFLRESQNHLHENVAGGIRHIRAGGCTTEFGNTSSR